MKIVTKLKIFGVFASILIIILCGQVYWHYNQMDLALERDKVSRELVQETFTLNVLTGDYTQTHRDRAEAQWKAQLQNLHESIAKYKSASDEDKDVLNHISQQEQITNEHFLQLKASIKEQTASSSSRQNFVKDRESILTSQVSIDTQRIVSLTSQLAEINSERVSVIRKTSLSVLTGIATSLGVLLLITYFFFAKSISGAIKRITEGTRILGTGKLDFRFTNKKHDEFGHLEGSFNHMANQLQEFNRAKDEFIVLTSHELRTPMSGIKGLVEMIHAGDYGQVPERLTKPLANISMSTNRQIHLINDLLAVSQLETGKLTFNVSIVPLHEVAAEVVASWKSYAKLKGVALKISENQQLFASADPEWVKHVLHNLIDNALKFTEKGAVTLTLEQKHDKCLISVVDTGIGILHDDQKKLFQKFTQLSTQVTGKPDGLGLGLFIAREIARKMHGDITIETSTPKKGSTFILTLPKAENIKENV